MILDNEYFQSKIRNENTLLLRNLILKHNFKFKDNQNRKFIQFIEQFESKPSYHESKKCIKQNKNNNI